MVDSGRIHVTLDSLHNAYIAVTPSESSIQTANEILQDHHDHHHVITDAEEGFHSHIVHHQLALLGLGATSEELRAAYEHEKEDQRGIGAVNDQVLNDIRDTRKFKAQLGDLGKYHELLLYFQEQIAEKGYKAVIKEYLLAGDERANDLLGRMYAGFLHPIIHLGYGIEFEQPAIVAEALAQAAIHKDWLGKFMLEVEQAAKMNGQPAKSLFEILSEAQANSKLENSAHWKDPNKIRDGIIVRAPKEMLALASQIKFRPDDIEVRTAEMINLTAYMAAGAQRANKEVKIDFFLMHSVNCSIFFTAFLKQDWLTVEEKTRLLEFKARSDITLYISRKNPSLDIKEVREYKPKKPDQATWDHLFQRMRVYKDDGHAAKLVRALANGEIVSNPFESGATGDASALADQFMLRGTDWLQAANMVVDSVDGLDVEGSGPKRWVRSAGFDEAWEDFGPRL